jgi:hypothetical protein
MKQLVFWLGYGCTTGQPAASQPIRSMRNLERPLSAAS